MGVLRKGDSGSRVRSLQKRLVRLGYPVTVDGDFDARTVRGVRAFQSQNMDPNGQPLVVDGVAGPLTQWSLEHPKPHIEVPTAVDYTMLPARGGSRIGRAALAAAIGELRAGAREIGGNNRGPFVQGFSYVLSRMDKLLGYGHVP